MAKRHLMTVLVVAFVVGCGLTESKPTSRSNEMSFANRSGERLSQVVVEWGGESFTITNEHGVLEGRGRYVRKLPINEPVETTFKITVHFPPGEGDPVVHEEKVSLDPEERKRIEVKFYGESRFSVQQRQRNPHIRNP